MTRNDEVHPSGTAVGVVERLACTRNPDGSVGGRDASAHRRPACRWSRQVTSLVGAAVLLGIASQTFLPTQCSASTEAASTDGETCGDYVPRTCITTSPTRFGEQPKRTPSAICLAACTRLVRRPAR